MTFSLLKTSSRNSGRICCSHQIFLTLIIIGNLSREDSLSGMHDDLLTTQDMVEKIGMDLLFAPDLLDILHTKVPSTISFIKE
jgi:hypothetical protein